MANRQNTLLLKRSNVIGKIPPISGLTLGEMALNTADAKLYSLFTSGSVSPTEVRQIGWDRISRTGDTVTGDFNIFGDVAISGSVLPNGYALTVTGDTDILGDLYVEGDIDYDGNLIVSGSAVFQSGITANTIYTDYIDFNTGATVPQSVGRVSWDSGTGTLNIAVGDSNTGLIDLQVGQEEIVRVFNAEATTLQKGEIVYVSGSQGNRPRVKRALATSDGYSVTTLGMVDRNITSGAEGYVTTFGIISNLNTLGLTGGTPIWLSGTVPGGYTSTKPIAPLHTVLIGYVVRVDINTGSIFVNISNGWELDELHDVRISAATEGDLLVRSSFSGTPVWVNTKTLPGSYTITGNTNIGGNLTVSGTTFLKGLSATTISATTIGASGDCIDDIYVSNIHSCSPLNINPLDEGNVYFGSTSGVTIDLSNNRLGVGITNPTVKLHLSGDSIFEQSKLTINQKNSIVGIDIVNSGESMYQLTNSITDWCIVGKTPSEFYFYNSLNVPIRFYTNASEKMTVLGNGNVGIGITAPTAKLHINNTTSGNTFLAEDDTNPDSSPFVIDASGRTGIGTSTPSTLLHVVGDYTGGTDALIPQLLFQNKNVIPNTNKTAIIRTTVGTGYLSGGYPEIWLESQETSTGVGLTKIRTVSNHPMLFYTNDLERARLNETGNFGINTQNPAGILHARTGLNKNIIFTSGATRNLIRSLIDGNTDYVGLEIDTLDLNIKTNGIDRMIINSSGNTGIGTITPTAKVHINNTTSGNTFLAEDDTNPDSSPFVIDASGNTGIGITTPTQKLDVAGNIRLSIGSDRFVRIGSSTNYWYDLKTEGDNFKIFDGDGTTRFVLRYSVGSVGIGVNLPAAKLHVNNTTSGDTFLAEDSTNPDSTPFVIDSSGNTGIGTLTPISKLHVQNGQTTLVQPQGSDYIVFSSSTLANSGQTMYIRQTASNQYAFTSTGIGPFMTVGPTNIVDFNGQYVNATVRGGQFGSTQTSQSFALKILNLPTQSSATTQTINAFEIVPSIITNSGYTGTYRGIYYNPNVSITTGTTHLAIETVRGDVIFGSTSGNVGIGTLTPREKLDVSGNTIISSGLTATTINVPPLADDKIVYTTNNGRLTTTSAFTYNQSNSTFSVNNIDANGNFNITGNTNQIGNFTITGNTTQSGNTTQVGNYHITGNTSQIGDTTMSGNTFITGNTSQIGNFIITGNTTQSGNTTQYGNIDLTGDTNFVGDVYVQGDLNYDGDLNITGNTNQIGNFTITGNTTQSGNTTQVGNYNVTGNTDQLGYLHIVSATTGCTLAVTGDTCLDGDLDISGNTFMSGNFCMNNMNSTGQTGTNCFDTSLIPTGTTVIHQFQPEGGVLAHLGDLASGEPNSRGYTYFENNTTLTSFVAVGTGVYTPVIGAPQTVAGYTNLFIVTTGATTATTNKLTYNYPPATGTSFTFLKFTVALSVELAQNQQLTFQIQRTRGVSVTTIPIGMSITPNGNTANGLSFNGIAEALHQDEFVLVVRNATGSGGSNSVRITDVSFSMFT